MIKFNRKVVTKSLIIVVIVAIFYPLVWYMFWSVAAISFSPDSIGNIRDSFSKLPSQVLITKIKSLNNIYSVYYFSPYPKLALDVLVERKEKEAVPALLKFMKSRKEGKRHIAIWALGRIGDSRAIEPLMSILKKGEGNPDYHSALMALSEMKYEGAFSYVVEEAKKPDGYRNGSVAMLKEFGKIEGIQLLLDMKSKVPEDIDSFARRICISSIDDTIKYLRSL